MVKLKYYLQIYTEFHTSQDLSGFLAKNVDNYT